VSPLFLLHGFTGSPASWDAVLDALPRAPSRTALVPTLLGHGGTSQSTSDEHDGDFNNELTRLARMLPPEPVVLAGYSLGARLALGLALAHPERIARLVLVSGQAGLASPAERSERRRADAAWCALLESAGITAFVDAWEALPLFASQARLPAPAREAHRKARLEHDPRGLARSLRATGLAEMPDFAPRLPGFTPEVSLFAGELDPKFSALARGMGALFPRARLTLVPNAGHDLLLERPDLVALDLSRT
jgi:2-succinyl-6-hydroxy-2,4-cyclohexadiene-1-carboxylate synthase